MKDLNGFCIYWFYELSAKRIAAFDRCLIRILVDCFLLTVVDKVMIVRILER